MKTPTLKLHYWKPKEVAGIAPIVVCATLQGKRKYYTTGVKVPASAFKDGKIANKYQNSSYLNQILNVELNKINTKYLKLAATGQEVKLNIEEKLDFNPLFSLVAKQAFEAIKEKCESTYIKNCYARVNEFIAIVGDLQIKSMTVETLRKYELAMLENGNSNNTINRKFKTIRQVANYAELNCDINIKAFKLFKSVSYVNPMRQYLTIEQIKQLESLKIEPDTQLDNVRNAFIIGCNTGLRYSDLEYFDYKKNVVLDNGVKRIIMTTKKTGESVNIKIWDKIDLLLQNLKPLPTNVHTNRLLKELAAAIDVPTLTFHLSRHSFATTLINKKVGIERVSKLLGHKDIKTTQIYAKISNPSLDDAIDILNS
jgi:site-specific recombinase XerD